MKLSIIFLFIFALISHISTQAAGLSNCGDLSKKMLIARGGIPNNFGFILLSYMMDAKRLSLQHQADLDLWAKKFEIEMAIVEVENKLEDISKATSKTKNSGTLLNLRDQMRIVSEQLANLKRQRDELNGFPVLPNPHPKGKYLYSNPLEPIVMDFNPAALTNPYTLGLDLDKASYVRVKNYDSYVVYEISFESYNTKSLFAEIFRAQSIYPGMQQIKDNGELTNTHSYVFRNNIILERPHSKVPLLPAGTPLNAALYVEAIEVSADETIHRFRLTIQN